MLDWRDGKGDNLLKIYATLNCVIASKAAKWGGYYKFRTKSVISAEQLFGSLVMTKDLTAGALRGVPMELRVRPVQVTPAGQAITVYVCHLELVGSDLLALQAAVHERSRTELDLARQVQLTAGEYRKVIGVGDDLLDDDLLDEPPGPNTPPPHRPGLAEGEISPEQLATEEAAKKATAPPAGKAPDVPPPARPADPTANSEAVYQEIDALLNRTNYRDEVERVAAQATARQKEMGKKHQEWTRAEDPTGCGKEPARALRRRGRGRTKRPTTGTRGGGGG